MLSYILEINKEHDKIILPYHEEGLFVKEWLNVTFTRKIEEFEPAMIKILDENNENVVNYCKMVEADKRKAGVISFSPICDAEGE